MSILKFFESGSRLRSFARYRTVSFGTLLFYGSIIPASAQMNTCGMALQQLQMYVARVNQIAQFEYQQGIPMRCQGNPMCGQAMFQQLNYWYTQQAGMVNSYYMQISTQCSSSGPTSLPQRADSTGLPRVSERDVKTLDVDDEDKTVKIRIPSTPQGFR